MYRRQSGPPDEDVINTSSFSAFTITKREQVSPTAFILTLRPSIWIDPDAFASAHLEEDDGTAGFLSKRIQEAWRHGLWSVEIKQPQLQIARHYTPLPPLLTPTTSQPLGENGSAKEMQVIGSGETEGQHEESDVQADLRILIRRMDGGEMSNYLSRQRVGGTIWLRGPHLGFDVLHRLGTAEDGGYNGDTETSSVGARRSVVFLAGGTGIAPALQITHRLLDSNDSSDSREMKPQVSILWANRWGADALGREQSSSLPKTSIPWFYFWGKKESHPSIDEQQKQDPVNKEPSSSLALQIQDLKRRHGSHFRISYFVDDEGSFIKAHDLEAVIASTSSPKDLSSSSAKTDKSCTWHSAKAVEVLPDDNDAARAAHECTCTPQAEAAARLGVNLLCVSGPDGFITAYAGAKRWHEGNEMQGAVGGLLARLLKDKGEKMGDWLVLKL
jgi:hypothetical protein